MLSLVGCLTLLVTPACAVAPIPSVVDYRFNRGTIGQPIPASACDMHMKAAPRAT